MEKENKNLYNLRHSAAHLLAQAVLELFPDTLLTIGPVTENGFFYDFLPTRNFKMEDLELIEKKMHEIAERDLPIIQREEPKNKVKELYKNNPFKLELIEEIPGDTVGISEQGDFFDLCRGGHVNSTGDIKYFKLLSVAGSYWRADKNKQALQRIIGTAFSTQKELDDFLKAREDSLKYDHRRLGKDLDLFSIKEEGPGFPFFHPKGQIIINLLKDYMRKLLIKKGYEEISTPIMLNVDLWKRSGHYKHYKENMYFSRIDGQVYALKPMNCPGCILTYQRKPHSYKELPIKLSEFGKVHRHELSGVLHGLLRVRSFIQDDAHIFCTQDQLEEEILKLINLVYEVLSKFGFKNIKISLATKPEKAMGSDELWLKAIDALRRALDKSALKYSIDEGGGAFYGPKIDFVIEDSMNREWQCSTIQVDFFLPENFDVTYIDSSGKKERIIMIHRAIYGSLERFFAILLEHYKGRLPFWLAPVQVRILTITDKEKKYAQEVLEKLRDCGIRVELDSSADQISKQIKNAQLEYIPWMIIIGKKEAENKTLTLRHLNGEQEFNLKLEELAAQANNLNKY